MMSRRHIPWFEYRDYQSKVRDQARDSLGEHVRGQVIVSLLIGFLAGLIAFLTTGVGVWPSLGIGVAAVIAWLVLAAVFFHSLAHVQVYAEAEDRENAAVIRSVDLQNEINERNAVRFTVRAMAPEEHGMSQERPGIKFFEGTFLFAVVENQSGPTAKFFAQYRNVQPITRLADDSPVEPNETWHALAWEDYPTRVVEIGYHGSERLLVADCWREPFCLEFRLPESAAWGGSGHGGHASSPPVVPSGSEVTFELKVVNQGEGKELIRLATVAFDGAGEVIDFFLDELPEVS